MGKIKFQDIPYLLTFMALAVIGSAGCSKAGLSSIGTNNTVSTYVVLMNMAPFAPSTEIYLNDIKSTSPVAPGNYSTSYEHLMPGSYDVKFKVAGSDSTLADLPTSAYDSLNFYTLILYNDDTIHKTTKAIKIADDFTGVTGTYAYFRIFDLCPDLASVDIYLNGQLLQSGRTSGDIATTGTQYTAFLPAAPAAFSLSATNHGSTATIAHLDNGYFSAGNAYTILLNGSAGNPNFPVNLHVLNAAY
jgi:Domain of unknown function (DUF4397)